MDNKSQKPGANLEQSASEFSKEFKKFVDVFDTNARLNREQTNKTVADVQREVEKLYELFENERESAKKSAEQNARLQSRKMLQAVAGLVITVIIAAASFVLNDHFNRLEHERQLGRAELEEKLAKLTSISNALTDVRAVKDETLLTCGTDKFDSLEVERKRLLARTNLVKASRNDDFYFGRKVFDEISSFIVWESSIKDYCSKENPADSLWREKHQSVERLIRNYFPESTFKR